ncbi:uncharacterized protein LOC108668302 [Hyalella azteca]|uniref:Uncharacterized protein LOC108668302 n=1 Tax=Hyalella azteca TaxID=294128 RepID=A0A8B7NBJ9_HYAAZ|nr:uncharacterized protein LOC108668302 [Hyalella azteca]
MRDEAVIQAARETLIAPAREGPYYLDNPRQKFYSQDGQDKYVKKIFRDMKGCFFFEVGALTGESLSNTLYLERNLGWTGVLMEPTPVSYHVLKNKNRRSHIMRACLAPDTSNREPVYEFVIHTSMHAFFLIKFGVRLDFCPGVATLDFQVFMCLLGHQIETSFWSEYPS